MSDDVTVDLTGYKDRVGGRVIPGRYTVVVDDTEQDKSQAGNVMINVWLRIVGGEFDGTIIIDRLTQTEKALFRTVNFMQALGLPTPHKRLKVNIRSWVGQRLEIDVEDGEPYLGRVKSEVRGYNKLPKGSGGAPRVADLDGLEEFAPEPAPSPVDPGDAGPGGTDVWGLPATESVAVDASEEVDLDTLNLG